jgi:hypothetical protein
MQSCLRDDKRTVTPIIAQLHSDGAVVSEIRGLLLDDEADYLSALGAKQGLIPSQTVAANGATVSKARTSLSAFLPKGEDPVVRCIEDRISTVVGQSRAHMEPLQVTDYTHKQEFRKHHDYFGAGAGESERTTTLFAYLEDTGVRSGECGGATCFHALEGRTSPLCVFPTKGNAVTWSNRTADGGVNPSTLHSGEPLTCEGAHKVGLNAWFRDQPYEP